jgi:hypothetical protein
VEKADESPSAFASRGKDPFPPTHQDTQRRADISSWTGALILNKIAFYEEFMADKTIWKSDRTKADVEGNLSHLRFEAKFLEGKKAFRTYIDDLITTQALEVDDERTE